MRGNSEDTWKVRASPHQTIEILAFLKRQSNRFSARYREDQFVSELVLAVIAELRKVATEELDMASDKFAEVMDK